MIFSVVAANMCDVLVADAHSWGWVIIDLTFMKLVFNKLAKYYSLMSGRGVCTVCNSFYSNSHAIFSIPTCRPKTVYVLHIYRLMHAELRIPSDNESKYLNSNGERWSVPCFVKSF